MAVGPEGGALHPQATQHHAKGVDERHGKQPQGGDRRKHAWRTGDLGQIGEQPGKDETQLHAAVVTQEAARPTLAKATQIEEQKAGNATGDHDDQ